MNFLLAVAPHTRLQDCHEKGVPLPKPVCSGRTQQTGCAGNKRWPCRYVQATGVPPVQHAAACPGAARRGRRRRPDKCPQSLQPRGHTRVRPWMNCLVQLSLPVANSPPLARLLQQLCRASVTDLERCASPSRFALLLNCCHVMCAMTRSLNNAGQRPSRSYLEPSQLCRRCAFRNCAALPPPLEGASLTEHTLPPAAADGRARRPCQLSSIVAEHVCSSLQCPVC